MLGAFIKHGLTKQEAKAESLVQMYDLSSHTLPCCHFY